MTPYERHQAVPYPGYSLQNIGGTVADWQLKHGEGIYPERSSFAS